MNPDGLAQLCIQAREDPDIASELEDFLHSQGFERNGHLFRRENAKGFVDYLGLDEETIAISLPPNPNSERYEALVKAAHPERKSGIKDFIDKSKRDTMIGVTASLFLCNSFYTAYILYTSSSYDYKQWIILGFSGVLGAVLGFAYNILEEKVIKGIALRDLTDRALSMKYSEIKYNHQVIEPLVTMGLEPTNRPSYLRVIK